MIILINYGILIKHIVNGALIIHNDYG